MKHSCNWCNKGAMHVMCRIHRKEDDNCCYCKPLQAIEIIPEPYSHIAKRILEQRSDEVGDCCYVNLDSVLEDIINRGIGELREVR